MNNRQGIGAAACGGLVDTSVDVLGCKDLSPWPCEQAASPARAIHADSATTAVRAACRYRTRGRLQSELTQMSVRAAVKNYLNARSAAVQIASDLSRAACTFCAVRILVEVGRSGGSVECERESQGRVDLLEFGQADMAREFSESFRCHRGRLLGEHPCLFPADGDGGAKDAGRRGARCRRDQDCREQQILGLDNHRVARAALFAAASAARCAAASAARCAQTVHVTAHEARPSP